MPASVMDGKAETAPPRWDQRAELLRVMLLDASADLVLRGQAAVDLACWDDRRAYDALWEVLTDKRFLAVAGDEVGQSLAAFARRPYAIDPAAEDLQPMVRHGVANAAVDGAQVLCARGTDLRLAGPDGGGPPVERRATIRSS